MIGICVNYCIFQKHVVFLVEFFFIYFFFFNYNLLKNQFPPSGLRLILTLPRFSNLNPGAAQSVDGQALCLLAGRQSCLCAALIGGIVRGALSRESCSSQRRTSVFRKEETVGERWCSSFPCVCLHLPNCVGGTWGLAAWSCSCCCRRRWSLCLFIAFLKKLITAAAKHAASVF